MRYKRNPIATAKLRDENILISVGRELPDDDNENGNKIESNKIKQYFKRRQYAKKRD